MVAIIVAAVGRSSETYIADHINQLFPGRTVVYSISQCPDPTWRSDAPVTYVHQTLAGRTARRIASAFGNAGLQRLDFASLASWLRRHQVRVVLCEYLPQAAWAFGVCRALKIPIVAHAHGYDISALSADPAWAQRYRTMVPYLDDVVVVSEAMKDRAVALGCSPDVVHVIPCGTVCSPQKPDEAGCDPSDKLLAVGRLIGKKGPMFLLETFRIIHRRLASAKLTVVGDGPFREPMAQMVQAMGITEKVSLEGFLPNHAVRERLRSASVFLQHSVTAANGDEEGLPVSILEAMAEGVPVVSTRHAGIPEAVIDDHNGYLVEPGDCTQMASHTIRLLLDAPLRRRLGAAGRQTIIDRYSIEGSIRSLRDVLLRHWPEASTFQTRKIRT